MAQPRDHAIPAVTPGEFRKAWQPLVSALPIFPPPPSADTAPAPEFTSFDVSVEGLSAVTYFEHLLRDIVPFAAPVSSPRCLAHMTGYVPQPLTEVGELVLALNQNMVKRDASHALTLLERLSIAQIHRLAYGFPLSFYERHAHAEPSTLGIVTSGGTSSNITALWVSRNRRFPPAGDFPGVEHAGVSAALAAHGYDRAVIVGSCAMHYSIDKAASVLGLGATGCIKVATTSDGRIDMGALRRTLDVCRHQRAAVIAIVGVAGTTDSGSIDPLDEMGEVSEEYEIPFHVDAAWGAPFLLSRKYEHLLKGIDRADSITIDGHKQLYTPIGTSVVLFRDPAAAAAIEKHTTYMLHPGSGDLGARSLEGSRPGSAMLLHAALHMIGRQGYERLVDDSIAKAQFMEAQIRGAGTFELLMDRQTNILLYRYLPPEWLAAARKRALTPAQQTQLNALNVHVQRTQQELGHASVGRTMVNYRGAGETSSVVGLRAVIANPLTTTSDISAVLAEQAAIAQTYSLPLASRGRVT